VSNRFDALDTLPQGARVGTSSLRRQSQLLASRPDLELITLRGNVDTRLRKLDEGQYDAIILAAAGLLRLRLEQRITHYIDVERSVPAVGQGIIGIECRTADSHSIERIAVLNDAQAWKCCEAERSFAERLQGSCQSPIGGFADIRDNQLQLQGVIASPDGRELYRGNNVGSPQEAKTLGRALAERLLASGAAALLERLRN
jgi:hydroxymethylbilane synthase